MATSSINKMDCKTCNIPDVNCYEQCRQNVKPKSFWNYIKEAASKEINRTKIDELFRGRNNK